MNETLRQSPVDKLRTMALKVFAAEEHSHMMPDYVKQAPLSKAAAGVY